MAGGDDTTLRDVIAEDLLDAIGDLAVSVRERDPRAIRLGLNRVLRVADGDVRACLVVAAAMIPVHTPVDPWWLGAEPRTRFEGDENRGKLADALGIVDDYRRPA